MNSVSKDSQQMLQIAKHGQGRGVTRTIGVRIDGSRWHSSGVLRLDQAKAPGGDSRLLLWALLEQWRLEINV